MTTIVAWPETGNPRRVKYDGGDEPLESRMNSPSTAEPKTKMDNVTFVVVQGLRDVRDDVLLLQLESYPWDKDWLGRMENPECPVVQFNAGFNNITTDRDILSPSWFERMAKKLLDEAKSKRKEGTRLVFFGENLGGIVLKRALILADTAEEYSDIVRDTCACVLFGVPHTAPALQAWKQLLVGIVIQSWPILPTRFWASTASLPELLSRTSSEFVEVALRIGVITVHHDEDFEVVHDDEFRVVGRPSAALYLSHERLLVHSRPSQRVSRFGRYETDLVEAIFQSLRRAVAVTPESREYMRRLSQLSPYTRIPVSRGTQEIVDKVIEHLSSKEASAVAVCGSHGTGKSILSYDLYKSLLSRREPSERVTFFAFDARDYRRRSVSAMLIQIIRQLLACEPELLPSVQKATSNTDEDVRWTEGNLWIQLRFIIRQAKCKSIKMVIDSLTDCNTDDLPGFLRALFNLRFAAPEELKIVCTAGPNVPIQTTDTVLRLEFGSLPEFTDNWVASQGRLADSLALESPKLEAARPQIKECLKKSEGFLHSSLIAHRIRAISSLSRPTFVRADLAKLGTNWEKTIIEMVSNAPSWVATAASWMLFARRPLRPAELAVAVALEGWSATLNPVPEFDEQVIPRDIEGDLRRQLGPLVSIERGTIQISHTYVGEVLQEDWLAPMKHEATLSNMTLTKQLVEYMSICLEKIKARDHKDIPEELSFGLLEYALEHWHVHYRSAMNDLVRPLVPHSTEMSLENLARSLLTTVEYRRWLRPVGPFGSRRQTLDQESEGAPDAFLLEAIFGIFDLVRNPMNDEDGKSDQIAALQSACRYGHRKFVERMIRRIDHVGDIEPELARACQRGDEAMVMVMLGRYKEIGASADIPPYLLPEVCRIGHTALAGRLIEEGAKVNEGAGMLPLHEAVDQGHLDIVDLLLKEKADGMALFPDKSTPLQHSIKRGYIHISRRLLQESGLRDTPNDNGVTALCLAAGTGDVELLKQIIELPLPEESNPELAASEAKDGESDCTKKTSPLHEAAVNGHLGAVKLLLDHHFPINQADSKGRSALFLALSKNHCEVANYLFEKGAEITFGKLYAESALKQAVIHGNVSATVALLERDVDPDGYDAAAGSPLTDAAWKNHDVIAKALMDAGADPGRTVDHEVDDEILIEVSKEGWTALHFAACYGSVDVMRLFMSEYEWLADSMTESGHTPLHLAVFKEQVDIVEIMLPGAKAAAGVDTNSNSTTPGAGKERRGSITKAPPTTSSRAALAALKGKLLTTFELDFQTDKGATALHMAVANGNIDLAKMLIVSGAALDPTDSTGRGVVHMAAAAHKNAADMVRLLLQHLNADEPDGEGKTALHYAAAASDEAVVLQLLRHGGRPNVASRSGITPLYLAAEAGSFNIVRLLVHYGSDVNARAKNGGDTPLHAAAFRGHVETAKVLIEAGADVGAADDRRDTPLHEAVRRGNLRVVELLLQAGADIDAVNTRRMTPLLRAVLNQWTDTAGTLLENGADPDVRDEDGDTALTAALLSEQLDMVKLLLDDTGEGGRADPDVLNNNDRSPLMLALCTPRLYLPLLLAAGPDVRLCGDNGLTVLHLAVTESSDSDVEDVRPLFQYGKDHLNLKDAEGLAPVHHAAKSGRKMMIQALHQCDADMATTDGQGRTAMHHAVRSMRPTDFAEVFAEFLRPSEENKVNVPDVDGWTPLHWACKGAYPEIVNLLLQKCETDEVRRKMILHKGEHGWTALAVAEFHRQNSIKRVLRLTLGFTIKNAAGDGIELGTAIVPDKLEGTSAVKLEDIRTVKPGATHNWVECDDCSYLPILGIRFKCNTHPDYDLCFKCYWHYKEIHFPRDHDFDRIGDGPTKGPPFLDPLPTPASPPSPVTSPAEVQRLSTTDGAITPTSTSTTITTTSDRMTGREGTLGRVVDLDLDRRERDGREEERYYRRRERSFRVVNDNDDGYERSYVDDLDDDDGDEYYGRHRPKRAGTRRRERRLRRMEENVGLWERVSGSQGNTTATITKEKGAEGVVGTAEDRNRRNRSRSRSKEKAVSLTLVPEEPPMAVEKTQDSDPDPDSNAAVEPEGNASRSSTTEMAAGQPDTSKMAITLFSEGQRQSMEVKTMIEKMRKDEEH